MPRQVIGGQPGNLTRVTIGNMGDLDHSYFRYCRIVGRARRGQSLRYVDMVESECRADVREADTTGLASWRTDTEGMRLTAEQADCGVTDLIRAYVAGRARIFAAAAGVPQATIDELTGFNWAWNLTDEERKSWQQIRRKWMRQAGLTAQQMRDLTEFVYSDLPNMKAAQEVPEPVEGERAVRIWRLTPDTRWTEWAESQWPQLIHDAIQRRDRWAVARAIEASYPTPLIALCRHIFPRFDAIAVPRAVIETTGQWPIGFDSEDIEERKVQLLNSSIFGSTIC